MRLLKEKMPKERVSPSMALLVIAVAGTAILSLGAPTTGQQAFAQANAPPDQDDGSGFSEGHGTPREDKGAPVLDGEDTAGEVDSNCWGDVSKQLAQADDGQAGLGHHASSFGEPRDGVGNQDEDTPAEHGDIVGDMNQPEPINCIIN
jgi:hypothetical protein